MTSSGGEPFRWESLVPLLVHPLKVMIVEACHWIDRPTASSELHLVFDRAYSLAVTDYHVKGLAGLGALCKVGTGPGRGGTKTYYVLSSGRSSR